MRGHGATAALLGCVAVVAAAVPAHAEARFAPQARFTLPGSNGYRVSFSAQGPGSSFTLYPKRLPVQSRPRRGHGYASVDVESPSPEADSYYSVSARRFTARRLSARIGPFGRVSVTFHRHRTRSLSPRGCQGRLVKRSGVFTGTIRFRGEAGYTEVDATTARGSIYIPRHLHCHFGTRVGSPPRSHEHGVQVGAQSQTANTVVSFLASKRRGAHRADFSAVELNALPGIEIDRVAFAFGRRGAFRRGTAHSWLVGSPPPFAGSAVFAPPHSWSGDLTVSFPGAPDVPLTGPGIRARLRRF